MNYGKQNDIDPFLQWHLDTDQIDLCSRCQLCFK
ncbi:hypothetical protein ACUXCC_003548 [Cytobacillus horneckiae]